MLQIFKTHRIYMFISLCTALNRCNTQIWKSFYFAFAKKKKKYNFSLTRYGRYSWHSSNSYHLLNFRHFFSSCLLLCVRWLFRCGCCILLSPSHSCRLPSYLFLFYLGSRSVQITFVFFSYIDFWINAPFFGAENWFTWRFSSPRHLVIVAVAEQHCLRTMSRIWHKMQYVCISY